VDVLVYLVSGMHTARLNSGTGHRVTQSFLVCSRALKYYLCGHVGSR